jgi:hypothetical protein
MYGKAQKLERKFKMKRIEMRGEHEHERKVFYRKATEKYGVGEV